MSNFIINFSRIILLLILSVSSQISVAMEEYALSSEAAPSLKKQRTCGSDAGETDSSGFVTPEDMAPSVLDRIKELSRNPNFTFILASRLPAKKAAKPVSKKLFLGGGKENFGNGSDEDSLKGAWYQKPDTGNWVLNLGPIKGYATIIPGKSMVDLLFGSVPYREEYMYPSILAAQQDTEDMASTMGFPFEKKKTMKTRKAGKRK